MAFSAPTICLSSQLRYVCSYGCRNLRPKSPGPTAAGQQRLITQRVLQRIKDAKEEWELQAKAVRAGEKDSPLAMLEKRGYVHLIAGGRDELDNLMTSKRIGAYVGVDPTGPSMHVGHLMPLMALFWMHVHGFSTITILGGATAQIGDPIGRSTSREKVASAIRKANMVKMHYQMKRMWANMVLHAMKKHGYNRDPIWNRGFANNNTWLNKVTVVEFLKMLGQGVRVGEMLGRDTARAKMGAGDGLSFAELAYPLLQAWDWWTLYMKRGVQLQIGGSDQFGNIVAGINAVNYIRKNHPDPDVRHENDDPLMKPVGFTVPLLTTSSGEKFGKSEGNAIYLDKELTPVFDQYQFFIRTTDADVARYLRLFTFIPIPEIDSLMTEHEKDPSKRVAQRRLAQEIIGMLHGDADVAAVEAQATALFPTQTSTTPPLPTTSTTDSPPPAINMSVNRYAPQSNSATFPPASTALPRSLVYDQIFPRVLYHAGLVASRSEGQRLIYSGGAYVGSRPGAQVGGMTDTLSFTPISMESAPPAHYVMDDTLLVLRVGKWNVKVIAIIPDEEFVSRGLHAPGWQAYLDGQRSFADEAAELERQRRRVENRRLHNAKTVRDRKAQKELDQAEGRVWAPGEQKRYEAFMRGSTGPTRGKAPTYADWLKEKSEFQDEAQD